jgi:uncharacterized delta-60 repeat protein
MKRGIGEREPRGRAIALAVTAAFASVVAGGVAHADPGDLDEGFGGDGVVVTDFNSAEDRANAALALPDGTIVAAGRSGAGAAANLAVARYLPDGSPDPSFGGGDGEVTQNLFGSVFDVATALDADPQGRLVAAGITGDVDDDFALARFMPGGVLDTAGFNPGGAVPGSTSLSFSSPDTSTDEATSVARLPSGDLLVAGFTEVPTGDDGDAALARFNEDGSLDMTFSPGGLAGRATHDLSGLAQVDVLTDIAVRDGAVYATGYRVLSGTQFEAIVARFTADGELHPTYGGGDGIVPVSLPDGANSIGQGLVLEPDGSAVVGGYWQSGLETRLMVAKFRPNGAPDNSFGGDGSTVTNLAFGPNDSGRELIREPGGRVTLVGITIAPAAGGQAFAATRYLPNGRLDRSFSRDGSTVKDITPGFPPNEIANAAVLAESGAIVAAGYLDTDVALLAWQGMRDCYGRQPTLAAYPGATTGTTGADVIAGDRGKLRIRGGAGDDRICGAAKPDRLSGAAGTDRLKGGRGNDRLSGSAGNDVLNAGPGKRDRCRSGPGNDVLKGCERGR